VIPHRSDTVLKVRLTQKDLLWCIFGYRRHCIAKTSGPFTISPTLKSSHGYALGELESHCGFKPQSSPLEGDILAHM
jgi:hypothetical protein